MSAALKTAAADAPIIQVRDLVKEFNVTRGRGGPPAILRAVNHISFDIRPGTTLGLVGESGSGKSTTGRLLVGLIPATSGEISLFGETITGADGEAALAKVRSKLQFVFQDPHGSLNPRMRVGDCIAEPIDIAGGWSRKDRADRVSELLETVGLPRAVAERFPHEFSGGQRQRIGIARALALRPDFVVCDEPVSALDVSMQAQIINLLLDLQERLGLSYLFIAHDLAVVRSIATDVAVMYAGALVEQAPKTVLYSAPKHPYTQALLDAVPRPDPDRVRSAALGGEVPSILNPLPGCAFAARCPHVMAVCRQDRPAPRPTGEGHVVACHLY
ncbi:MAG: ATP-binding cassette domain-containing protein [Alphaproteobacteria bacterium]|nr:ATP-binding cassette domain-containing protein [Alphaproteobacteria bacterium]